MLSRTTQGRRCGPRSYAGGSLERTWAGAFRVAWRLNENLPLAVA